MKKIFVFTVLWGTMLLVSSCVQPLDDPMNMHFNGTFGIDLSVICTAPGTKAVTESEKPGVDALNENTVSYVDWFIFMSDSDTEPALLHDRAGEDDIVQTSTDGVLQTELIKIKGPISMDNLVSANGRDFYVYTIANLPDTYSHDDIGAMTLTELKALSLVADFNVNPFSEQDNFVMSGGKSFSFADSDKNNLKKVDVDLKRVAAKVTINMNVAPAIDQMTTLSTGGQKYVKTWYPSLSDVQVYLSFANAESTIEGDPIEYDQTKFFTYNREAFAPTVSPATSTTPDWDDVTWKWNVTGTPFYSYPMSWASDSPQAPFLKVILKWTSYEEDEDFQYDDNGKLIRATARNPQSSQMIDAAKEFYYKIPIPAEVLNSNEWYNLTFDVSILGSTADELPVELGGQYCVVDWSTSDVEAGGSLKQGSYLSVYSDTYYIYGKDYIDIPVLSSHDLITGNNQTRIISAERWNPKTQQWQSITRGEIEVYGRSSLTFNNAMSTDMDSSMDCYIMRFTVRIVNGANKSKDIAIIQYPSIYIDSKSGGNAFIDGYYGNVNGNRHGSGNGQTGASGTSGNVSTPYGAITRYETTQTNLTVISVSAFSPNSKSYSINGTPYDYIISDPRQDSGFNTNTLTNYYTGTGNTTASWGENASKIKIGSLTVPNYVAPKLIIASRWSRLGGATTGVNFEQAQRRCATYQEAGYPAGRWRLPTEAEINFIVNLQKNGFIDELFLTTQSFSASGSTFVVNNNQITYAASYPGTDATARCVYDAWYWGENAVAGAQSSYTIGVE